MGVITGFTDLDYKLEGGLQKGSLYVLAARPSMGKTGLAINMVDSICLKQYRTAVYFSLEMSSKQIVERLLALEAGIDPFMMSKGIIDGEDWICIAKAAETMAGSRLIIDDTPCIEIQKLRSKCLEYRRNSEDLAVIFIDYLQLMSQSEEMSREKEVAKIVKGLKELAKEIDRPIVVLSQLSRSPEKRKDHRPILSDFMETREIVNVADVVMFLYRDDYYDRKTKAKGIAEIIVAKNKNGPVGVVQLKWDSSCAKFSNITREK